MLLHQSAAVEKNAFLGFWGSAQDRAEWTVELTKAGTYEAWIDLACPQNTAGNPFVFTAGSSQLRGKVPATASWDDYQKKMIGRISLPAGSTGISFRSDGAPQGFLLDLRGIQLVPTRLSKQATQEERAC